MLISIKGNLITKKQEDSLLLHLSQTNFYISQMNLIKSKLKFRQLVLVLVVLFYIINIFINNIYILLLQHVIICNYLFLKRQHFLVQHYRDIFKKSPRNRYLLKNIFGLNQRWSLKQHFLFLEINNSREWMQG